jgi:broad specificity phosphatase PhoE
MLDLAIVRHGESVRNHASDLAHRGDTTLLEYQLRFETDESAWDLTQRGIEQARVSGLWIRENIAEHFDGRYVSPFKRSRQTAANLGIRKDHWVLDERIRERDWGIYWSPGLPIYTVEQYLQDLSMCGGFFWKGEFPGAESVMDMIPRCHAFLEDLWTVHRNGKVILVTHGGTMKTLQVILEHLTAETVSRLTERRLINCSVLHYQLEVTTQGGPWTGRVRFASPILPDSPVSDWQPLAGDRPAT